MSAEIFKFPYDVSRRVHSRKPRRSKNGTPEERAAKAAAGIKHGAVVKGPVRMLTGAFFDEFVGALPSDRREQFMADVWKVLDRHLRKAMRDDFNPGGGGRATLEG
jgi:hypothetical protein